MRGHRKRAVGGRCSGGGLAIGARHSGRRAVAARPQRLYAADASPQLFTSGQGNIRHLDDIHAAAKMRNDRQIVVVDIADRHQFQMQRRIGLVNTRPRIEHGTRGACRGNPQPHRRTTECILLASATHHIARLSHERAGILDDRCARRRKDRAPTRPTKQHDVVFRFECLDALGKSGRRYAELAGGLREASAIRRRDNGIEPAVVHALPLLLSPKFSTTY